MPRRWLRIWFGIEGRLDRRTYLLHGCALLLIKYAGDVAISQSLQRRWFLPQEYVIPAWSDRLAVEGEPSSAPWLHLTWALPFLWIGFTMTMRRARDAGLSSWHALWFLVPVLKFPALVLLALQPSAPAPTSTRRREAERASPAIVGMLWGLLLAVPPGLLAVWLLTEVLGEYANSLFVVLPFVVGLASSFVAVRKSDDMQAGFFAAVMAVVTVSIGLLGLSLEGLACILMAVPIWLMPAALGAILGATLGGLRRGPRAAALVPFLALPLTVQGDVSLAEPPMHEVVTTIEIDAPPATVWRHVVEFAEIPPPSEWWFQTGIAYPVRAHIDGAGVGAVRHCEFTTGPFVEPITVWDPPHLLAFDVTAQPAPMQEWSLFARVHPPHLDGYFRSRRGEFRLIALPGRRTRLEGRTWYTLDLEPLPYWRLWADWIVHRIHERVLHWIRTSANSG
jgi:uncharacterized membrane protein YhaH (DUF805 family)